MPSPDVLQVWLGSPVRIPISTSLNGVPTSPSSLSIELQGVKGGHLEYELGAAEIVEDAEGELHAIVVPTHRGRWYWRWESNLGASEGTFEVETWIG
jgi:hypothetical protein